MYSELVATAPVEEIEAAAEVPLAVLESLLRDHLGDRTAAIDASDIRPLPHQGTNDSTTLWRVDLSWAAAGRAGRRRTDSWIVKHWRAGGERDVALGIFQPREALAWERGWLRPDALPSGIVVPFIGARRSPDKTQAWLAMADVSAELSAYARVSLSGEHALGRTRTLLARLAALHAAWEQPERQAELRACAWLLHPEHTLWSMAAAYARALGRRPVAHTPLAASGQPAWDGLSADLDAFLEGRPADERQDWRNLLIDRRPLAEGLAAYPHTLLHNDLDDRNIGLRWPGAATFGPAEPDLVLIDWEWVGRGPAVLDVANVVQRAPVMIAPGQPVPEAIWSDALADEYFRHYRAAGGRCADAAEWRRAFGLALVAQGLTQMPFVHGSLRRAMRGELPPPQIVGVPEAVVRQSLRASPPTMGRMEERVIREARRWLG